MSPGCTYLAVQYLTIFLCFSPQVKQIMEEAVTRKFVHEDSASITSLCGNNFKLLLYSNLFKINQLEMGCGM